MPLFRSMYYLKKKKALKRLPVHKNNQCGIPKVSEEGRQK